jgi:hypothetical protein
MTLYHPNHVSRRIQSVGKHAAPCTVNKQGIVAYTEEHAADFTATLNPRPSLLCPSPLCIAFAGTGGRIAAEFKRNPSDDDEAVTRRSATDQRAIDGLVDTTHRM